MNEATTIHVGGADRTGRPAAREGRRLRPRHLWLVPGLALAIFANELGKNNGVGILLLVVFGIAPDLPRLLGLGHPRISGLGRLPLHVFNVLHHPVAPVAAVAFAATGIVPVVWLVGALVWTSHVVIGWALGDVRRPVATHPDA